MIIEDDINKSSAQRILELKFYIQMQQIFFCCILFPIFVNIILNNYIFMST